MNIHYLQHVPFEDLGSIEDWANIRKHQVTVTRLYEEEALPSPENLDWLIIMGGPMNVYEEEKYPWFVFEKQFIEHMIKADKVVLGICLGAQLIADVLGARIYKNTHSAVCENQAFIYSDHVVALQFHLETTRRNAEQLIAHCGDEIVEAPFIQTPEEMLSSETRFKRINAVMSKLLEQLEQ